MLNDPVTALTENQVRQIVSDEISKQLTDLETRISAANRQALQEALKTVPTEDTVRAMIEGRIADTRTELQASISSVDLHLRRAEGRVSEAVKRIDKSADRFEATADKMDSTIIELKSRSEINAGNIASHDREIDVIRSQADSDRTELTQTIDKLDSLKADIHGDKTKPEMPSLSRMIALTNDSINNLNTRVARYDTAVNFGLRVWSTKLGKAVILLMLTAFATNMVYYATKIIEAVVTGRVGP